MLTVLSVGLLPVLLLTLLATVEEDLAAAAPQRDLVLLLPPLVHLAVYTDVPLIDKLSQREVELGRGTSLEVDRFPDPLPLPQEVRQGTCLHWR